MYINKNPYELSETMKMHEHCGNCGLKYKIEPNFFFGAMYVSYALAVLVSIIIFLISAWVVGTGIRNAFIIILVSLFLLMPWITRISRNIYINLFIHYQKPGSRND